MATKLTKTVTREVELAGAPHTVRLHAEGLEISKKRARTAVYWTWEQLAAGEPMGVKPTTTATS